jgi:DmsE family decaheme c-type cytochrome
MIGNASRIRLSLLLLGLALLLARSAPAQDQAAPQASTIDIETCRTCHEEQVATLQKTYHGKLANSCANCHGDQLAAHVEQGDPKLARSLKSADAATVNKTCLGCHDKARQANWTGGMHERRGVACTNCHGIHKFESIKSQIKTARESETCFNCHATIRAQMMRTSHHPVREGKIGCGDCHDPHDSRSAKYISAASVNEKCFQCHAEKRGPFLWEHAPVRENCLNCHNPHGSNHEKLLISKRPFLCQGCHSNTQHPGTLYDLRQTVAGASPSSRELGRACQNCHANIHGSNAPSGPYLGR